ncbi:hypothetical protein FNT36_14320 [Hymenobacter setariae]|uniref:Uncharacterized protein n=1 Tax=Hymenobacter setariae TaxID=2594794 RepID=A0A558BVT2_9BACT|nr:hypothetical protein [Hymenobacter setariae]TVT40640.1 hypothetical protein FNT36_14320 [Hymenobacter setariae]
MMVLLVDAAVPILDGRLFFVLASVVLLLGIGVRVWLGQGGGSVGELNATKWLGRLLAGGVVLVIVFLICLAEWMKKHS